MPGPLEEEPCQLRPHGKVMSRSPEAASRSELWATVTPSHSSRSTADPSYPRLPRGAVGAGRRATGRLLRPARGRQVRRPDDVSLWTNDRLVDELGRLLDAL